MNGAALALACLAVAAATTCAAGGGESNGGKKTVRVEVPAEVEAAAAARRAGDAAAATPVLMLEGLEVVPGEALTVRVLGPAPEGSEDEEGGEVLAVAATVGSSGADPSAPPERMTLALPFNDRGAHLVAAGGEVVLTLEVEGVPGRPELTFERAYFDEPGDD